MNPSILVEVLARWMGCLNVLVAPIRSTASHFWIDRRAAGEQLDFLNAMILLLVGMAVFMFLSSAIMSAQVQAGHGDRLTAMRTADRLAVDVLKAGPGSETLDRECTKAYFQRDVGPGECEHVWSAADDDQTYLARSLGLRSTQHLYVRIVDTTDTVAVVDSVRLELGEVPVEETGDVFHRRVLLDVDDDGDPEWFTLEVVVW